MCTRGLVPIAHAFVASFGTRTVGVDCYYEWLFIFDQFTNITLYLPQFFYLYIIYLYSYANISAQLAKKSIFLPVKKSHFSLIWIHILFSLYPIAAQQLPSFNSVSIRFATSLYNNHLRTLIRLKLLRVCVWCKCLTVNALSTNLFPF